MAPDADKLRQRKAQQVREDTDTNATTTTALKIGTVKTLGTTEIVIDGDIYDIKDFDHPGGESVLLFGGNDVTVTYKMIHPYHTNHHLEKMKKVGTVPDYQSE
jgi:acyl-lipid (7-3)-desaturase (Delta-4 desaturase)